MGCVKSETDPTLYLFKTGKEFSFLVVYVDDVLLIGNQQWLLDKVIERFSKTFEIKVSKKIDRFLRMTINEDGVEVNFPISLLWRKS